MAQVYEELIRHSEPDLTSALDDAAKFIQTQFDSEQHTPQSFKSTAERHLKLVARLSEEIRNLVDEWNDLIKKITQGERVEATAKYDTFVNASPAFRALSRSISATLSLEQIITDMNGLLETQNIHNESLASTVSETTTAKIQLPSLTIRRFKGERMEWPTFWASFEAAVDSTSLPEQQKFAYLLSFLDTEPARFLQGMPITAANYVIALDILKTQFGKEEDLKRILYQDLMSLPFSNNIKETQQLVFDFERIIRQLESLGEDIEAPTIYLHLEQKIAKNILHQLNQQRHKHVGWTTTAIRDELKLILQDYSLTDSIYNFARPFQQNSSPRQQPQNYQRQNHQQTQQPRQQQFQHNRQTTQNSIQRAPPSAAFTTNIRQQQQQRQQQRQNSSNRPQQRPNFTLIQDNYARNNSTAPRTFVSRNQSSSSSSQQQARCQLCTGTHSVFRCTAYATPQSRMRYARERSLCVNCLSTRHNTAQCPLSFKCRNCNRKHHTALCDQPQAQQSANLTPLPDRSSVHVTNDEAADTTSLATNNLGKNILLSTIQAKVSNPKTGKKTEAIILLDSASHRSFVVEELIDELGLEAISEEPLTICHFGASRAATRTSAAVALNLHLADGEKRLIYTNSTPTITQPLTTVLLPADGNYAALSPQMKAPNILLGADLFWDLVLMLPIQYLSSGVQIVQTKLGPMATGKMPDKPGDSDVALVTHVLSVSEDESKTDEIKQMWDLDSIGITDSPHECDDDVAFKLFKESIVFVEGRYAVNFPWRSNFPNLPSNFQICVKRLHSCVHKLRQTPELLEEYNRVIQEQREKGIIEEAPTVKEDGAVLHYLPHQGVVQMRADYQGVKKVRVVYDASARSRRSALSLNDALFRGPVMLPDLAGVLLRFRLTPFVLASDIEKAFLMVSLRPESRDCTRFIWLRDLQGPVEPSNFIILRFCRVPFGIVSSPFLLSGVIDHHLSTFNNPLTEVVRLNTYVDNVILPVRTAGEAKAAYRELKQIFDVASMNLREFLCNDQEVMNCIDEKDKAASSTQKVLGIKWDAKLDTISIKLPTVSEGIEDTKRKVVQFVAKIFDPYGLTFPARLSAKLFIQQCWIDKCDWDEKFSEEKTSKWKHTREEWKIPPITIPRQLVRGSISSAQIHVFVDASKLAYACAVYLRVTCDDRISTQLIFSKARLNSTTPITIPRMELLAILIGVRAKNFVEKEIQSIVPKLQFPSYLWTDSQAALSWIHSTVIRDKFVENRLIEIRKAENLNFRFVHTSENPADTASRGCSFEALRKDVRWWKGPPWVSETEDKWPAITHSQREDDDEDIPKSEISHGALATIVQEPEIFVDDNFQQKYNSWSKLLRVTAFLLRFLLSFSLLQKRGILAKFKKCKDSVLQAAEITNAEIFNILLAQQENPPDSNLQIKLRIEKDGNGLFRCPGRVPLNSGDPIFLPRNHHATRMIILYIHEKNHHAGVPHTLAEFRTQFYTEKARLLIRSTIKNHCVTCRHLEARPFARPPFPILPHDRVNRTTPFQSCGIDLFGPLNAKDGKETKKIWTVLLTCFSTRAIHMELVDSLSAQSFLNALRRFTARRGVPHHILSDNATNFCLAKDAIENIQRENYTFSSEILTYFSNHHITWKMTAPSAPWQGALYERIIRDIKNCMRRSLRQKRLTTDELHTFITEVESVMNTRPLAYVSEDGGRAIRPIDLIGGVGTNSIPLLIDDEEISDPTFGYRETTAKMLVDVLKRSSAKVDAFWKLWRKEYIAMLRERQEADTSLTFPQIGTVVQISDENLPRGSWRLGVIQELCPSADGIIRSVEVKVGNGRVVKRPIILLYPIEIPNQTATTPITISPTTKTTIMTTAAAATTTATTATNSAATKTTQFSTKRHRINKISAFWLLNILSFFCLFSQNSAKKFGECSPLESFEHEPRVVYAPTCEAHGEIILEDSNNNFCWTSFDCSNFLFSATKFANCAECKCVKPSIGCSHYNGTATIRSNIHRHEVDELIQLLEPKMMCFTNRQQKCTSEQTTGMFFAIELFDKTKHIVDELHLKYVDYDIHDLHCLGDDAEGVAGTPSFCSQHKCSAIYSRFCYYSQQQIVYLTSPDSETTVPIRRWWQIEQLYHEFAPEKPKCDECSVKCHSNGVHLHASEEVTLIESCVAERCFSTRKPEETSNFEFPKDILLNDYSVQTKFWIGNVNISQISHCRAQNICDLINCFLCWERLANPQCAPKEVIVLIAVLMYIAFAILSTAIRVIKNFSSAVFIVLRVLRFIVRAGAKISRKTVQLLLFPFPFLPNKRNQQLELPLHRRDSDASRFRYRPMQGVLVSILTAILFAHSSTASGVISAMTANSSQCSRTAGEVACKFDIETQLTLSAMSSETTLLLQNDEAEPMGQLQVQLQRLYFQCSPRSLYFSRPHRVRTLSVKRCASAGSCQDEFCGTIATSTLVHELNGEPNEMPGSTFCRESCGGPACGCFFPTPGCAFYRSYAITEEARVLEVFDCAAWQPFIDISLKLQTANETVARDVKISVGEIFSWRGIRISAINPSFPPSPLLSEAFVSDGQKTAMIPQTTPKQLICDSRAAAEAFNCTLAEDVCTCNPVRDLVNCRCKKDPLESELLDNSKLLPIDTELISLRVDDDFNNSIAAHFQQATTLQLLIRLENFEVRIIEETTKCEVAIHGVKGCYRCLRGAEVNYTCQSLDAEQAIAHVVCPTANFALRCTNERRSRVVSVAWQSADIDESCNVSCTGGVTTTRIAAKLHYVAVHNSQYWRGSVAGDYFRYPTYSIVAPIDLRALFDWLIDDYRRLIGLIVAIGSIFVVGSTVWRCYSSPLQWAAR